MNLLHMKKIVRWRTRRRQRRRPALMSHGGIALRILIRRILFRGSWFGAFCLMNPSSAETLFWEIYFIYTLGGKVISKILNIGQEFMKKIDFANTQPLLMTFTLLKLYHLCLVEYDFLHFKKRNIKDAECI